MKLENILIDTNGYLKVSDFGLAKAIEANEESNTMCGTPEYLAPEIVKGRGHDKNVDWWGTGIMIFEMMFGVSPFYNPRKRVMYQKIATSRIVFP